jgi:glycosyltransferase involved in cell wall biosynthesis
MKKADRYIALSQTVKELYTMYGYRQDRIDVIPNFVEEQVPASASMPVKQHDRFNILYVGRLKREKGVDILIRAFHKMLKQNSKAGLTIVGAGPETETLRNLVSELDIEKEVLFTGQIPHRDIWRYYRTADIFVHPGSWAEPFGRTILEAMQYRLPIIVSNAGAPPEIVGNAGLVFERGNVGELTQKLQLVFQDQELSHSLSSNCSTVLQTYQRDRIMDRIMAVYYEALKGKG